MRRSRKRAGGSSGGNSEMDFNLTGCFWGMPVNFSGDIAANFTAGTAATPSYITLGAALLGALVGGLITFFITYAKGRTEMKYDSPPTLRSASRKSIRTSTRRGAAQAAPLLRGGPGKCGSARFRSFQAAGGTPIVPAMTRMRYIVTAPTAPLGARFAVHPRGLLLLTLR